MPAHKNQSVNDLLEDDGVALVLVVLVLLALDGHVLEGGEGGDHAAADPGGVLAVEVREDVDLRLRVLLGAPADLEVEALLEAGEHGGAAREHDVVVEVRFEVAVALLDAVEGDVRDAPARVAPRAGREQDLRRLEALVVVDLDYFFRVRQLVAALLLAQGVLRLERVVVVQGDRAHLLLHFSYIFIMYFMLRNTLC